jgi:hypothetical protein
MTTMTGFSLRQLLAWLCAAILLAGCGGGGGGGDSGGVNPGNTTPGAATTPSATAPSVTLTASGASVVSGTPVTLTWEARNTGNENCTATGDWTGLLPQSGSRQVTPAPSSGASATYGIACGAATGSVVVAVTAPVNTVAVTVDTGPQGATSFNIPFVDVTVCRPGTNVCQTIDHVMVDTGSYGLRLVKPLDPSLGLPAVKAASGAAVGECGQFVSGYTWGAIAQADVKLGGETASAQSVQVIGQAPAGMATPPAACSNIGKNIGTVATLGANGILGVGLFKEDCGTACVYDAPAATYYACASGACTSTALPLAKQVSNPVASFRTDNNGVVLTFPSVGASGATRLTGTLTFGIGTQANNALGSAARFHTDTRGNFTTVYNGKHLAASFIDSGSNGLYFNDPAIPACTRSDGFYCPPSPLTLTATMQGYGDGASIPITFTLQNIDTLPGDAVTGWVGGTNGSSTDAGQNAFDWGLPFFFGRKVFVGMETATTAPYWAF